MAAGRLSHTADPSGGECVRTQYQVLPPHVRLMLTVFPRWLALPNSRVGTTAGGRGDAVGQVSYCGPVSAGAGP